MRFQIDGNYPASNVVVRDTISTNLDLSTFRFIGSKHPVSYYIDPSTREMVFRFSGIQLAPSQEDIDGSQGYFSYSIKENPNLVLNSEIKNTAYIYFDFNPTIIPNTTLNINGYVGLNDIQLNQMDVYPNPTNGILQINGIENGQLRILSCTGQLVYDKFYKKGDNIDLTSVKSGLYFLQMNTSQGEFTQKVILMK